MSLSVCLFRWIWWNIVLLYNLASCRFWKDLQLRLGMVPPPSQAKSPQEFKMNYLLMTKIENYGRLTPLNPSPPPPPHMSLEASKGKAITNHIRMFWILSKFTLSAFCLWYFPFSRLYLYCQKRNQPCDVGNIAWKMVMNSKKWDRVLAKSIHDREKISPLCVCGVCVLLFQCT